MKKILLLLPLFLIQFNLTAQTFPKTEFRGTWIASVYNLDWPKTRGIAQHTTQKNELTSLLDTLKRTGINALILQVRPNCDALYSSNYDPWSYWLTGSEGTAPNPLWDPLTFAVEEAHKRGMELHAWINPYRVKEGVNTAVHSSHIIYQQPSWILTVGGEQKKILNPGLEAVRNYLVNVILDIVNNYDIDGIHFDDYFYPYSPNQITTEDAQTFSDYPRGFTNIGDWRRDNVNILIEAINNAILSSSKPYVKFGISPFGIWKSGTPTGITGTSAYNSIYCDAIAWLQNGSIDYLMPQLYWKISGSQDYDKLMNWWADSVYSNNRLFYPGQQFTASYDNYELPAQMKLNRANNKVKGNSLFRADRFVTNMFGFKDSLINNYYKYKAIVPSLNWKNSIIPNPPVNLTASSAVNGILLNWTAPAAASDGDLPRYYAIYRSNTSNINIAQPQNLISILFSNVTSYLDTDVMTEETFYYAVTSIDPYRNESVKSNEASLQSLTVIENFESGVGLFNTAPTFSGSTTGILAQSSASHSTSTSYVGSGSLQVTLKDNTSSSNNWTVRLLSGSGTPSNNVLLNSNGYIGYWLKTNSAPTGAEVSIAIREGGVAGAPIERGVKKSVINDNNWNLYQWNLSDNNEWESFTGNGNIDSTSFTLDAIFLYAPNDSPDWTLYIDYVAHDLIHPLPVQLVNFTADVHNNNVTLNWQTATEINNYGFEIERTPHIPPFEKGGNMGGWEKIGFVEGHGNSNSPKEYSFTDNHLPAGNYSYRLKQIDNDGSFEYSQIIKIDIILPDEFILYQNYPNPFNPVTKIKFSIPYGVDTFGKTSLKIYNILGDEVTTFFNETKAPGIYEIEFNAENISSGVYFYQLRSGSFVQTKKMILLR